MKTQLQLFIYLTQSSAARLLECRLGLFDKHYWCSISRASGSRRAHKITPYRIMLSLAVSSPLKPVPISKKGVILPLVSTSPLFGVKIFAIILSKVVFPLPLNPSIPNISPFLTENEMGLKKEKGEKNKKKRVYKIKKRRENEKRKSKEKYKRS